MNCDENVINILEEDSWTISNCLEEKTENDGADISDVFKKRYDLPVDDCNSQLSTELQAEAEIENECILETADFVMDNSNTSNSATSTLNSPIWIVVNKKTQFNRILKYVGTEPLSLKVPHLADNFNNELIKSNIRNLPNILRGPKVLSKSNISSPVPFEAEDNSLGVNNLSETDTSEKEENKNTKKTNRKRKQTHNPLVIQEDSIDISVDTELNYCDESTKTNKLQSTKAEEFEKNYQKETNYNMNSILYKRIRNKISLSPIPMEEPLVQNSSITTSGTMCTNEQINDQTDDLNISFEFDELCKEQFHEDYTDHLDILADALKEYQHLNDSYDHKCCDKNSNQILNSNGKECSKLKYNESSDYDREQNEYSWNKANVIEDDYLLDYENYLNHMDNFVTSSEDLESTHVSSSDCNSGKNSIYNSCNQNCSSSFLSDSSDDEFSLKALSYNNLQNSFNKDEARNLDSLLLEEEQCQVNLEDHLNNELNVLGINFKLTNDTKNTTPISLSNDMEHTITIREDESNQCSVLSSTDLLDNISLDYPENTKLNDINLLKKNHLLIQESIEGVSEELYNYTVELSYERRGDKLPSQVESDESTETDEDLSKISKPKAVVKTLQCLLCALTFTSKRTLALHLAGAHGGMYVILCERCGRLFNKKCLFNRHFIHCGCVKLPFGCQKCNKTYRHKSSLLHHLKLVHQIEHKRDTTKLYKCNICFKVYRKYGAFEKHLNMHISF